MYYTTLIYYNIKIILLNIKLSFSGGFRGAEDHAPPPEKKTNLAQYNTLLLFRYVWVISINETLKIIGTIP